ncbi:Conserved_hypothetical protein [Hexamita inflata]|uniref:Uncharacterized protein n=1 Tax=Hexamita inflata TaxID=28002 RepID=A0AA86RN37_9EUKA|nr:Conserved hypothetical protein [Hexamita inflata]CAI9976131.1 Conserved hypothetical protein [Hexamita inflata]
MANVETLNKKIENLEQIVNSKSTDNKELVAVMRSLVAIKNELVEAQNEYKLLNEQTEQLKVENKQLKENLSCREYQILHLSRNLREQIDKQK